MLKVGNKVKIKELADMPEEYNNGLSVLGIGYDTLDILRFRGEFTVKQIVINSDCPNDIYLAEDEYQFAWHEKMLDKIIQWSPQVKTMLEKIQDDLNEYGFINDKPGMYQTYNGPRIGEIRMAAMERQRNERS